MLCFGPQIWEHLKGQSSKRQVLSSAEMAQKVWLCVVRSPCHRRVVPTGNPRISGSTFHMYFKAYILICKARAPLLCQHKGARLQQGPHSLQGQTLRIK